MASTTGSLIATTDLSEPVPLGWLRNPQFDFTLIAVVAGWALASGAFVVAQPAWFWPIVFLDVWLLGYTHVVSTFTRLAFDRESFRQHRLLLIPLPVAVAAFTIAIVLLVGDWLVGTIYLYAQWFHYMRQSYGISRMYLRKAGAIPASRDLVLDGVIYGLPLWGILYRSYQKPSSFLGLEIVTLPVPTVVLYAVGTIATASVLIWIARAAESFARRQPDAPHSAYVASHIAIFASGYLLIDDISSGWLVLNIWHNLQYVLIVWMHNANRFGKGVDPQRRFLSTISQPQNVMLYAVVCWALGTVLYFNIDRMLALFSNRVLPLSLLAYMTINFHHYVVDAVIWRRPRNAARAAAA
jgi:hypothetical protein